MCDRRPNMSGKHNKHRNNNNSAQNQNIKQLKNVRVFQNENNAKTKAEDSSFRVEVYQHFLASSLEKNSIGKINISDSKIKEINQLLNTLKPIQNVMPYEEMKNNFFKQNFLEKRKGDLDLKMDYFMEKMERNAAIDHNLFLENNEKLDNESYLALYNERKKLPVFTNRNQIIKMIEENQVILLSGDTGCGKTTQVPQFILDEYIQGYKGSVCKIVCTQPRRISAIAVAERVAEERGEKLGISCGYQIRMEKVLPRKYGSILYATNGIVIRHMESDPAMNNITHLILDEIHERDIHSDFLLAIVKQLISKKKELKVILMSATLNEQRFMEYFDFCPHISIKGLSHPVELYYLEDVVARLNFKFQPCTGKKQETNQSNTMMFVNKVVPYVKKLEEDGLYSHDVCKELMKPISEEMNLQLIFELTLAICEEEEEGAILIFVTGYDDINQLYSSFCDELDPEKYILIGLHSQIPIDEQRMAFEDAPPGTRKIIIATNIAETSITINDVVYVIDCGWAKVKTYDARTKTENLEAKFVSKANAIQRKGRAGRLRPGKCYRLYTKARFECLYKFQKPEILRSRLEGVILQMKLLQLGLVRHFFNKLLDPPENYIIESSLSILSQLEALDEEEGLTPLGYYLARLPIAPQLGKMLLFAVFFGCLDPVLNIAVGMDYKSPFVLNLLGRQDNEKMLEFSEGTQSDHLLIHKALLLYQKIDKSSRRDFCREFSLHLDVMKTLVKMKKEFMELLYELQLVSNKNPTCKEWNFNANNIELIKAVVCGGLYPNIIVAFPGTPRMIFQTMNGHKARLHQKSILSANRFFSCPLLAFYIKLKTSEDWVHDATVCSPYTLVFLTEKIHVMKSLNLNTITVNNIKITCDRNVCAIVERLKDVLDQYLLFRLTNPSPMDFSKDKEDLKFLKVIVDLLASPED